MNLATCKRYGSRLSLVLIAILYFSNSGLCQTSMETKTIVYYFHRTVRCPSCNLIEQLTRTAVLTGFEKELQAGTLEFKSVNVDEESNDHFIKDYNLSEQSVILSKEVNGNEVQWENMDRVWDLLHKETEFIRYIQYTLQKFIALIPPPIVNPRGH